MGESKIKPYYLYLFALPAMAAISGGTVAIFSAHFRGVADARLLLLFALFSIFQCVGLFFLFLAKLSSIRKGVYSNFGFKGLSRKERFSYVAGYTLLVCTTIYEIKYAIFLS